MNQLFVAYLIVLIGVLSSCKKDEDESKHDIISGCMDHNATNYNSAAGEDDGSCMYPTPKALFHSTGSWLEPNDYDGYVNLYSVDSKTLIGKILVYEGRKTVTCTEFIDEMGVSRLVEPGVHEFSAVAMASVGYGFVPDDEHPLINGETIRKSWIFQIDVPSNTFYCEPYNL